jgi:purine-cytosine permease-like protein
VLDLFSINENREFWRLFFNMSLGTVITFAALRGIKGIGFLADLSLPFLFLTLGYAAFTVEDTKNLTLSNISFSYAGASLVIALAIAFVIDMPTFYRFAKTSKDGLISISLIFILVLPVLEIIGVYLASGSNGGNILEVLKRENETFWNLWVAFFIILAGWTTNNVNLYSAAICLQSLKKNFSEKKATLCMGGAGTLLSCFDLLTHLEFVLDIIGIFIASMGAVILMRYLMMEYFGLSLSLKDHPRCLMAWVLGIAVGFIGIFGYSLTSIAMLDAVLGASVGTILTMKRKEYYEKAEY